MPEKPRIVAMDLEGVLVPEIWIAFAEKTGIEQLRLTTRDIPDYDRLMRGRLEILKAHRLHLKDIQEVIGHVDPLQGAVDYMEWLRERTQVIILSDTFYEFAMPLMKKLSYPTLFCNTLEIDENGTIVNYHLRQKDGKKKATASLKALGFFVIAMGDSYNDTTMLSEADVGVLFRPPENVIREFPQYQVFTDYKNLIKFLDQYI